MPINTPRNLGISDTEKVAIVTKCIKHQKEYLALPINGYDTEYPFWDKILQNLVPDLKAKFANVTCLKNEVKQWCNSRRDKFMNSTLPPPRESLRELDENIDQWNQIWCQRWSRRNWNAFDSTIWKVGEERIIPYIRQELPILLKSMLQERERELATLARLPVLAKDSNIEEYRKYLEDLTDRIPAGGPSSSHIQQTEALLSLVLDLTPGLEKSLLHEMNCAETRANVHKEDETDRHQGDVVQPLRQNNVGPDSRYFGDRGEDIDMMATTYHHDRESPVLGEPTPRSRHRMDTILPSTETLTPATTPNTLAKLHQYEQAHLRNVQSGSGKAGQTAPNQSALKRKATKSWETCTPETNSKRARLGVGQSEPPNSVASTFSFPSVSRLALSMRPRTGPPSDQIAQADTPTAASGVASHDDATPAKPLSQTMLRLNRLAEAMSTPSPQEKFIRPAAPRAIEALRKNTDVTPRAKKKRAAEIDASHGRAINRVNQNPQPTNTPVPSDANNETDTDEDVSFRRFRESTEDFHAMTPSSREKMLYRAVKSMYRKPSKR